MNIDKFLLHLILLITPGFIGVIISRSYKSIGSKNKGIKEWYDLLEIIFYTLLSCIIYDLFIQLINYLMNTNYNKVFNILISEEKYFDHLQFFILIILNILIGIISAYFYNYKLLYKFGKLIRVTKHYGEEDVWSFLNNSDDIDWVYIRDLKTGLTYFGCIEVFSDSGEKRELILSQVSVYTTDRSTHLYDIPKIYFARDDFDIVIEIPNQ